MLRRSRLVLGRFSTHFEFIIEGFKAKTLETQRGGGGGGGGDGFWVFFGENKLPLGGNTLGFVLRELLGFVL